MGAGEQRRLLPVSPKSLHANQTFGFPYHLPLLPLLPSTGHYTQGKSLVEQSTKDFTLETIMSELREVMGDMSLKVSAKRPEHCPLHETDNRSQGTAMDPCSWDHGMRDPVLPARSYWELSMALSNTASAGSIWSFSQLKPPAAKQRTPSLAGSLSWTGTHAHPGSSAVNLHHPALPGSSTQLRKSS